MIKIPNGSLRADDSAAAAKRKKLRDALLNGNTVIVNTGEVKAQSEANLER